jgi:iron(III) transport system substrate-binding protein
MRRIIKESLLMTILLSATTFAFVFFIPMSLHAADVLKVYTHADVNEMEKWAPEAEKVVGMKIEWSPRFTSTELWTRVQSETPNFLADMLWGFLNAHALIGAQRGYFMPYKSPAWADIPERFRDPDSLWYGYNYWFAAITANTKLLKEKNLPTPKSWMDLTNPVYKGEVVMPNPGVSGTAFVSVAAIMQIYGEAKGWEYLEKLDKNVAQYTKSGSAPADLVARGEYAIGISWDQAIYGRVEKGFPIIGIVPVEGTAFDLESVAILKGCKQMKAAQKLVDWLGSKEGQTFIGTFRSKVTRPGIPSLVKFDPNLIKYDAIWAGENQKRIMDQWKEKFKK